MWQTHVSSNWFFLKKTEELGTNLIASTAVNKPLIWTPSIVGANGDMQNQREQTQWITSPIAVQSWWSYVQVKLDWYCCTYCHNIGKQQASLGTPTGLGSSATMNKTFKPQSAYIKPDPKKNLNLRRSLTQAQESGSCWDHKLTCILSTG